MDTMSETRGVRNILRTYYHADLYQLETGRAWYPTAMDTAIELALTYDAQASRVAGVLAALSPGISWRETIEGAERILQAWEEKAPDPPSVPGYKLNAAKAWRILAGPRDVLSFFDANTGPKTFAFVRNILGETEPVTVDGHAVSVREGERFSVTDARAKIWPARYRKVEADYVRAAKVAGETPRDMQAITWVTWHALHNIGGASLQQEIFPGQEGAR